MVLLPVKSVFLTLFIGGLLKSAVTPLHSDSYFADYSPLNESFVRQVIGKCVDIGLFHKEQFEENGILTSRAIQKKYESITARRAKQKIESRFCVLDGFV